MTTPFDKHAEELIGSTKNSYILLDRYEACIKHTDNPDEIKKELEEVTISFRVFTLSDEGFYELGQSPPITNIFAITTETQRQGEPLSLFLNPVYTLDELGVETYEEIQQVIAKYNYVQYEKVVIDESVWGDKMEKYPLSENITSMVKYLQTVIGKYELWFSENLVRLQSLSVDTPLEKPSILRKAKHGELRNMVDKYARDLQLPKGETVPSIKIRKIVNLLNKYGLQTNDDSVRTTLSKLGYSDAYKSSK